jgi:hypothetical protein
MQYGTERKIGDIRDFKGLVQYLRDELDWPLDLDEIEDLTFEYEPDELGLKPDHAVKVKEIKQLRPVVDHQPWGIFWVEFENRALPVTVMRQILRALVYKKRASAKAADRKAWHLKDLIFMSSLGEKGSRRINFSYFRETGEGEPTLQTFFWDEQETQFYWLDKNHLERLRWPADTDDVEDWRRQWAGAFTAGYREPVRTAKDLSERLAALAANTRDAVLDVLRYESATGPLHRLLESFQTVLLHDLEEAGFADMVAQTIAYGLFSARCTGQEVLGLAHLEAMVPNTNRFLKELFAELARISGHKKGQINFDDLGLSAMVILLRDKNIEAVLEEFGRQAGGGKEDPVIHFYQTFLDVYDKQQRVQRGVFYTPKPVVSFIVRSVHETLQKEFGLTDGLADTTTWGEMAGRVPGLAIPKEAKAGDPFVQILDPATGTGTFLEEVVEVVHATMIVKWQKQGKSLPAIRDAWNEYVPKHLLPRLRGFELMMAPYAVAHMKIGLKLRQTGYDFKSTERLRVYLTNTLEPPEKGNRKLSFLPDFLSHESLQADAVKERKATTVIVGNPPYSALSANLSPAARSIVDAYRYLDGQKIKERSMLQFEKNIQDDYIKFIAISQQLISRSGAGVIGLVTNHSYLDGPTLRGMRASLLEGFTALSVVDLHGNGNKKEVPPNGETDQNVFDILQGTAISIFRRLGRSAHKGSLSSADLWGQRESKYDLLLRTSIHSLKLVACDPVPQYYFFLPKESSGAPDWDHGVPLNEVFVRYSTGTETGFDELMMDFSSADLKQKIRQFTDASITRSVIKTQWRIDGGHAEYLLDNRRAFDAEHAGQYIRPFQFRSFDYRWAYVKKELLKTNSFNVMEHLSIETPGIVATRQTKERFGILVTGGFCGHKCTSGYDRSYVFPGWVGPATEGLLPPGTSLLKQEFVDKCRAQVSDARCSSSLDRDVFHYIVALLSSPGYEQRYKENLKREFPRVFLPKSPTLFNRLSQLGADLAALFLLAEHYPFASWNQAKKHGKCPLSPTAVTLAGEKKPTIDAGYPQREGKQVYINSATWFERIDEECWDASVGAFQVCEKWLKDRRGRKLSNSEICSYSALVTAIAGILNVRRKIDSEIESFGGWPLQDGSQ